KILELAETPSAPFSTVKRSRILIGIFIGIIFGIALAFLFEFLDQTIKEPRDLEKALELPLLGIVPQLEEDKPVIDPAGGKSKTKLEPFRVLRTNLKHIAGQHNIKSLIICSPVKGEGKTTLAVNLAITFAMDGKRIILVDGDLRRPQIHNILEVPKKTGFSDYIMELAGIDEIIKPTRYENLSIITAGERPNNPTELLGTVRFDTMLQELCRKADLVIFDSPALLPVSDSLNMAPKMDGCVLIGRNLWTPMKAAKQAKMQLKQIGSKIYGVILNGISHSRGYYPYYYGYYRYYAYKYTYDYDEEPRNKRSMREIGLKIESKVKERALSLKNAIPRYFAYSAKLFAYLAKRRTFWALTVILAGLVIFGAWLRSRNDLFPATQSIEYLGPSDELSENERINPETSKKEGRPLEALSRQRYNKSSADSLAGAGDSETPFDTRFAEWYQAFSEGTVGQIEGFYDSEHFRHPKGDFSYWQSRVMKRFRARNSGAESKLDTMWNEPMDQNHRKALSTMTFFRDSDTAHIQFIQIWSNQTGPWKIVRQKHMELP
ncbi:MAG: polysaccharide biosynthesis tyrosine autokinase, partial [Chitinivibrionales bacterium]|nr:polysaccharide biosynthesis tyrosine autokinase [Chitinivibrionales bacterium]